MPVSEDWQAAKLEMSDTTQPMIQVRYIGDDDTHTIALDNNGGGSTDALLVTITDDSGATTFDVDGADETAATIQAVVDGINALTDWEARRYNAPSDYTTDSNDFIDIAATDVPRTFTNYLYRDADQVFVSAVRLSNPETGDLGDIELALIQGNATYGSGVATITVSTDPGPSASEESLVYSKLAAATTVESDIFDGLTSGAPLRVKGPVLVEMTSTAVSACDFRVLWRPVNS